MIYLDNAATSFPKPKSVVKEVARVMEKFCANPGRSGHQFSILSSQIIFNLREKAAEFFDLPNCEQVILTKNATEGLNIIIKGIIKPGDRILISSMEHNSVLRPAKNRESMGAILDIFEVDPCNDEKTLENFKEKLLNKPKLVCSIHASNVFGNVLPVQEMAALCKEAGIVFLLDASQSAGILPIDIEKEGYSFVCCPGHKGLYGPQGTGLLLINSDYELSEFMSGGTGSLSKEETQPKIYPNFFESGTLNTPGAAGLLKGLEFLEDYGRDTVTEKEKYLTDIAFEELFNMEGVNIYAPGEKRVGLFSLNIDGIDCETVASELDKYNIAVRSGLHCSPLAHRTMKTIDIGTVRVSFSVFNTKKDVLTFCDKINRIRKQEGLKRQKIN